MVLAVDVRIGEGGGEEPRQRRRHYLHTAVDKPLNDRQIAESIVLDVDFSDQPHARHLLVQVYRRHEVCHGFGQEAV